MKKPSSSGPSPDPAPEAEVSEATVAHASPYKSAAEELDRLRKLLREVSQQHVRRIDSEIARLRAQVVAAGEDYGRAAARAKPLSGKDTAANAQLYDLRDMTTLLRTLEVKAAAGRRKDLKKIESLVEELQLLVGRWK